MDAARCLPLAILLAVAGLPSRALATWQTDGNPVCTAAGVQSSPAAIGDGAGGLIVAWFDQRPVSPGIYAQRLLADGSVAAGWPADGVRLSGTTATGTHRVMSDGGGGALVVWVASSAIYAQRVDANGALHAGWPAGGKLITSDLSAPGQAGYFSAVTDGAGGAYFAREKMVSGGGLISHDIHLTRITADGVFAPGWTESGRTVIGGDQATLLDLTADPAGGVIVGTNNWYEAGTQPHNGFIEKDMPNGSVAWGMQCLIVFGGSAQHGVFHIATASNGSGGAYATWRSVGGQGTSYYGQHVNSGGTKLWPQPYNVPFSELVVQDGTAGVWFVGRPAGTDRLEVHRRDLNGFLPAGWTSAGVVTSQPSALGVVAAKPLPTSVVLCWSENTSGGGYDIRAISVERDATIPSGWPAGGGPVCTATGDQLNPALVLEGTGAVACWEDRRLGAANPDIYANRITIPQVVAVDPATSAPFGIVSVAPVPARDRLEVSFAPGGAPATIAVLDVTGREIARHEAGPGATRQSIALAGLPNGLYFVRIVQGPRIATSRFAVLH